MTLFFIEKSQARVLGRGFDESEMMAVWLSEVIVIVDKAGRWLTTKDKFKPHGRYVPVARRVQLLCDYFIIVRPTSEHHQEV